MADMEFSEEAVLEAARQATGLSDFGDDRFREGLGVLLETYAKTAGFNEKGVRRHWRRVVSLLAARLRIRAAFARHPEIRERSIERPVYLTGLPRTGTSALFNLMGMDPTSRPLLLWEGIFPDPPEGLAPGEPDPRVEALRSHYAQGRAQNPEFTKIHFTDADRPEECVLLLAHAFCDMQMGIEVLMEPYASWFLKQDFHHSYAYYRDLLKMIDWQRPGDRWLLKSPAHVWALDILIEMFPDVCLIMTHRNPIEVVSSYCSMMDALMVAREHFDRRELGPVTLENLAKGLERALAVRDASDPMRFIDVDFDAFVDDSMAEVQRIYDHFALDLPPDAEATMQAYVDDNPRGKHGAHEHDLAKYGLSPDAIKDRLASYIDRFDLPTD
jgi:hypothetical protein